MSDDKPWRRKRPDLTATTIDVPAPAPPSTGIPVKVLYLRSVTDVPGRRATNSVIGSPIAAILTPDGKRKNNSSAWCITYKPEMRHHEITFYPGNPADPPVTVYVHESGCYWESMP